MAPKGAKVRLLRRTRPIVPVRSSQLVLAVNYAPGDATLAALTLTRLQSRYSVIGDLTAGARWRIIASPMTIPETPALGKLHVPHAMIKPQGDVREFLTAYAEAGGPHHVAVCYGDARGKLRLLARLLGADYVEV